MVRTCAVFNCKKRFSTGDGTKFFRIPSVRKNGSCKEQANLQHTRKLAWLKAIYRSNLTEKQLQADTVRVCSRHFITGCPAKLEDITNPDWIPSLHLGHNYAKPVAFVARQTARYQRQQTRIGKANDSAPSNSNQDLQVPAKLPSAGVRMSGRGEGYLPGSQGDHEGNFANEDLSNPTMLEHKFSILSTENKNLHKEIDMQKTITEQYKTKLAHEIKKNEELVEQNKKLELEVRNLNSKLYEQNDSIKTMSVTREGFINNDKKTLYYTGLISYPLLDVVYSAIESHLPERKSISKFQQLLVFLMRMRLYFGFTDLAYRFNVSANTVSSIFYNVLDVCYGTFHHIVRWPSREELHATMPMKYQLAFGNKVAVIIDCFEVFAETPTSLSAHSAVYSYYKKHVTAKFLIGITPQGTVAFVSNGYGGRKSDKFITEDCGILNNLRVGDFILSDRGFDIADVADIFCCTIKMPPFKKGKKQLEPSEIDSGRKISQLRIDVERVIGALRNKFKILCGNLKTRELKDDKSGNSPIDKIVTVACALFNHCPGIVETY